MFKTVNRWVCYLSEFVISQPMWAVIIESAILTPLFISGVFYRLCDFIALRIAWGSLVPYRPFFVLLALVSIPVVLIFVYAMKLLYDHQKSTERALQKDIQQLNKDHERAVNSLEEKHTYHCRDLERKHCDVVRTLEQTLEAKDQELCAVNEKVSHLKEVITSRAEDFRRLELKHKYLQKKYDKLQEEKELVEEKYNIYSREKFDDVMAVYVKAIEKKKQEPAEKPLSDNTYQFRVNDDF